MRLPSNLAVGLLPSMVALQGQGSVTALHRHHGMHLLLAREGELAVSISDRKPRSTAGILTPPQLEHAVDAGGRTMVLFFVDPESMPGKRLERGLEGSPIWIDEEARQVLLAELPAAPDGEALRAWMHHTLSFLEVNGDGPRTMHPKVKRVLRLLEEARLDPAPTLEDFADQVGLAPSRLRSAFMDSTGTPWRAYVRWLRLQRAARALSEGVAANEAAVTAGFFDAAHMARTFQSTYGISSRTLMGRG